MIQQDDRSIFNVAAGNVQRIGNCDFKTHVERDYVLGQ